MSSTRIVLLDPLGAILFSGESLSARSSAAEDTLPETLPARHRAIGPGPVDSSEDAIERCPETLRSAGSGVFRAVDRRSVADVAVIERRAG